MKLEVKDLHKSFGNEEVLHGISFSTYSGKAFGLLGRNGAGKTTTIRVLMDIFKADQGEILLDGKPLNQSRCRIGYLPEERGLYPKRTVDRQLLYFAKLKGMSNLEAKKNMHKWLTKLDILSYEKSIVDELSKGTKQKVQLAQALICDPDIIILDEPFSGIDPVNGRLIQNIIKELVRDNKMVIFSSHQMNYVEEICEEVAVIKEGNIVFSGSLEKIKENFGASRLVLKASNLSVGQLEKICFGKLKDIVNVYDTRREGVVLELKSGRTKNELLQALMQEGIDIELFGRFKPSLTDIFVLKAGDLR